MLYKVVLTKKPKCKTIYMKAIEQYFYVVLFIMLYKVVLTKKPKCKTIYMKAIEQYFYVVLFIMLYKVAFTFKTVDEKLTCDHSNESY